MGKGELTVQIRAIFDEQDRRARNAATDAIKAVSKEALKQLRNTSPKSPGGGEYAKGWSLKSIGQFETILYNKTKPGLTHLLERGHLIKNQYGEYGRSKAIPHIKPVEEWANNEVIIEIERRL